MTPGGQRVVHDALVTEAVAVLQKYRRGELAVVDESGNLAGQVALKDLVSMHFL